MQNAKLCVPSICIFVCNVLLEVLALQISLVVSQANIRASLKRKRLARKKKKKLFEFFLLILVSVKLNRTLRQP